MVSLVMNRKLAFILVISFVGVAVFGFIALGGHGDSNRICLADIINPARCSENRSSSHPAVFKSFSAAVLVLAFALLALLAIGLTLPLEPAPRFTFAKTEQLPSQFHQNFIHWFKILEKRDPAAIL